MRYPGSSSNHVNLRLAMMTTSDLEHQIVVPSYLKMNDAYPVKSNDVIRVGSFETTMGL